MLITLKYSKLLTVHMILLLHRVNNWSNENIILLNARRCKIVSFYIKHKVIHCPDNVDRYAIQKVLIVFHSAHK